MSDITDAFAECIDAQNEANDARIQARINGQEVDCVLGIVGTDLSVADGGLIDGATNTLQVAASALRVPPEQEQIVVIGDQTYDILAMALTGGIWTLTIGDHEA